MKAPETGRSSIRGPERLVTLARWAVALLLAVGGGGALPANATPATTSPRTTTLTLDDTRTDADVYVPAGDPPIGVAIVAHGWTRSKAQHRDLGIALADAGVVAIVPDLPNVLDLRGNGTLVVELVGQLEAGGLGMPPTPRSSIVLIGTSAGGLATVHAASKLPGLAGWIGLDPVDRTGTGIYAASELEAPAIVFVGDASACNLFGSGRTIARAAPHLVRMEKIAGASHCDFESPTSKFCTRLCGSATREKQDEILRDAVSASVDLLRRTDRPYRPRRGPTDTVRSTLPPGDAGLEPEPDSASAPEQ
ncbi:MAG: hypothetical protein HS109_02295 [Burkholderiales bacterium]|nr:hypothetical protein [Burkholderiales bacterium]MCE7877116.1 hypothetical protein [Betaproteobacteria bacterium PRO3]